MFKLNQNKNQRARKEKMSLANARIEKAKIWKSIKRFQTSPL